MHETEIERSDADDTGPLFILPACLIPAGRPTFLHKAHSCQLQVELPDKLDAFCTRRPKSPLTVVVFLGFHRPWVDTPQN